MADLPTTTLLVGLAVALARAIEWLAKSVVADKNKPRNGNGNKAGDRSTEEWEGRMRKLHEESNRQLMEDMRGLLNSRNDKLREILRDELRRR